MLNKTDEADRLAQDLTELTGETVADAVTNALRERLDRVRSQQLDARPAADVEQDTRRLVAAFERGRLAMGSGPHPIPHENTDAFVSRISKLTSELLEGVDRRPITEDEWTEAGGDDLDLEIMAAERQKR